MQFHVEFLFNHVLLLHVAEFFSAGDCATFNNYIVFLFCISIFIFHFFLSESVIVKFNYFTFFFTMNFVPCTACVCTDVRNSREVFSQTLRYILHKRILFVI